MIDQKLIYNPESFKSRHAVLLPVVLVCFAVMYSCSNVTGQSESSADFTWNNRLNMAAANDQELSEEQKNHYRMDAEKLAVRYVNAKDSTHIVIPHDLIDLLYNGLVHIFNSNLPEAELVTRTYEIHAGNPASPREILVFADSTAPWLNAWRNGETQTGNADVDELIDRFNLSLVEYNELVHTLETSMATLRADNAINVYAAGRQFQELPDIKHAGPDIRTDGSDISVLFFDNHLRYSFSYGFGDCPAGCINKHTWSLNVYLDGTVEFAGEKGDPLPGQ